jgi:hypothetical protein
MNLPNAFCWTKMGDESGEPLSTILYRKELERSLGKGLFMWGIGNPLGQGLWTLVDRINKPIILFSKMKSKAKVIDSLPKKVVIWTSYLDSFGDIMPLPEHVLLTSRGSTSHTLKNKHYALVCHKNKKIGQEDWEKIKVSGFKNINSEKKKIGYSQVTAIIERNGSSHDENTEYQIMFSANLVNPYFIRLIDPVELPKQILIELNRKLAAKEFTTSDWMQWLANLKKELIPNDIRLQTQRQNKLKFLLPPTD